MSITNKIKGVLYQNEKNDNKIARFMEWFVTFSRKFGWLVILVLYILRNHLKYTPAGTAGEFDTIQIIAG